MLCVVGLCGLDGIRYGLNPWCLPFTWGLRIMYDHVLIPVIFTIGEIGCSLLYNRLIVVQIISMWYTAQLAIIALELMAFYVSTLLSSIVIIVDYYLFKRIFPSIFQWIMDN